MKIRPSIGTYDYIHGAANEPNRRIEIRRFGDRKWQIQADVFVLNLDGEKMNRIGTIFGDRILVQVGNRESMKRKREGSELSSISFYDSDSRSSSSQSQGSQPYKRRRVEMERRGCQEIRISPSELSFINGSSQKQAQEDLALERRLSELSNEEQEHVAKSLAARRITIEWVFCEKAKGSVIMCGLEISHENSNLLQRLRNQPS